MTIFCGVGRRRAVSLSLLLFALLASGCGMLGPRAMPPAPQARERVLLADVEFFGQEKDQCGPAALAMALVWSGLTITPNDLRGEVFTPGRAGSLQNDLLSTARRHGRLAYPVNNAESLLAEIAAGHPVLVLLNLGLSWYPQWHYAVVVGYDRSTATIFMHSGTTPFTQLSFRVFANTWKRGDYWGVLVLPPGRLPATVAETTYLQAVIGLEKAQQWAAAVQSYQVATRRWPESSVAWLGLGNSRYAGKDLPGAEAAFRAACRLAPTAGPAWNNLAQVLWEQGDGEEALAAASRAVSLGGPLQRQFAQTLAEIRAGMPR